MIRCAAVLAWLLIALPACTDSSEAPAREAPGSDAADPADAVRREARELGEAVGTLARERREAMLAEARAGLEELDERIADLEERLQAQWDTMDGAARDQARERLDALEAQRERAGAAYERLKTGSGEALERLGDGLSEAMTRLREAWQAAADEFDGGSS